MLMKNTVHHSYFKQAYKMEYLLKGLEQFINNIMLQPFPILYWQM